MWIVTFTDMISLLLTFFIMILTFSSMEEDKFKQATGSLTGAFGVITHLRLRSRTEMTKSTGPKFRDQDQSGPTDPSIRSDVVEDNLRQVQDRDKFKVQITAQDTVEGTRISIVPDNNREIFDLGSDRLSRQSKELLGEVAKMFATLNVRLVVETHVDDRVWTAGHESARHLSRLMALSAAQTLEDAGMPPERVGIAPKGALFPVAGNEEAIDRYRNRRLIILVIPNGTDEAYAGSGRKR